MCVMGGARPGLILMWANPYRSNDPGINILWRRHGPDPAQGRDLLRE